MKLQRFIPALVTLAGVGLALVLTIPFTQAAPNVDRSFIVKLIHELYLPMVLR